KSNSTLPPNSIKLLPSALSVALRYFQSVDSAIPQRLLKTEMPRPLRDSSDITLRFVDPSYALLITKPSFLLV
ncbi:MAG: hypothetical protein PHY48_17180, partial [Candidatus Cloacimonetes bacterium]|nr:hypothetical protein [Candidatus Cloacimonadota bacterium]